MKTLLLKKWVKLKARSNTDIERNVLFPENTYERGWDCGYNRGQLKVVEDLLNRYYKGWDVDASIKVITEPLKEDL